MEYYSSSTQGARLLCVLVPSKSPSFLANLWSPGCEGSLLPVLRSLKVKQSRIVVGQV